MCVRYSRLFVRLYIFYNPFGFHLHPGSNGTQCCTQSHMKCGMLRLCGAQKSMLMLACAHVCVCARASAHTFIHTGRASRGRHYNVPARRCARGLTYFIDCGRCSTAIRQAPLAPSHMDVIFCGVRLYPPRGYIVNMCEYYNDMCRGAVVVVVRGIFIFFGAGRRVSVLILRVCALEKARRICICVVKWPRAR